jgi:hypothetical protein
MSKVAERPCPSNFAKQQKFFQAGLFVLTGKMRQRGRKSSASLLAFPAIEAPRPGPEPPSSLTKSERTLFIELAASAEHLRPSDGPLLASLVHAITLACRLARDPAKIAEWDKAARTQMALARSLRLTPQSRTDSRAVGRQKLPPGPAPWE